MNTSRVAGTYSVAILNENLNKVIDVDYAKHQMRVGVGMDIGGLLRAATEHKMSVQVCVRALRLVQGRAWLRVHRPWR